MGLTFSGVRRLFWRRDYEKIASDDAVAVDMLCSLCAAAGGSGVVVVRRVRGESFRCAECCAVVAEDELWVDEVGRSSLQSPVPSKGVKRCAKSAESA